MWTKPDCTLFRILDLHPQGPVSCQKDCVLSLSRLQLSLYATQASNGGDVHMAPGNPDCIHNPLLAGNKCSDQFLDMAEGAPAK